MRILRGGLSIRERLTWAVVFAVFGVVSLWLYGRRFDDTTSWWGYIVCGVLTGAVALVAVQWRLGNRDSKGKLLDK